MKYPHPQHQAPGSTSPVRAQAGALVALASAYGRRLPLWPGADLQARQRETERAELIARIAELRAANRILALAAVAANERERLAQTTIARQHEILSFVSHELRCPLGPLSNATAVLARSADANTRERVLRVIERQIDNMTRLIEDLLDLGRVQSGKFRLVQQRVDLVAVIGDAVQACQPHIDRRRQQFVVDVTGAPLQVDGDALRLGQMLCNLLDNASKYTQVGGRIGLHARVVGDEVVLTVSDNGMGMAADVLPTVFEPFTQDRHATDVDRRGLGIGLTVVRELAEAHGGRVAASSPGPGLGSQFVLTLPLNRR